MASRRVQSSRLSARGKGEHRVDTWIPAGLVLIRPHLSCTCDPGQVLDRNGFATGELATQSIRTRQARPCGDGTRRSSGRTRTRNELHGGCGGWRVRDGPGHWGTDVRGVGRRLRLRRPSGAGCACLCRVFAGLSVIPRRSRSDPSLRRVGGIAAVRCVGASGGSRHNPMPRWGAGVAWISNAVHGPGWSFPRLGRALRRHEFRFVGAARAKKRALPAQRAASVHLGRALAKRVF